MRAKSELHGIDNKFGIAARPERVLFAIFFMYFNFDFVFVYLFTFSLVNSNTEILTSL